MCKPVLIINKVKKRIKAIIQDSDIFHNVIESTAKNNHIREHGHKKFGKIRVKHTLSFSDFKQKY
jgi:hypothetical protein